VEREQPIRAVFFRTETGNEPVREWLKDLPKHERKIIGEDIKTVQYSWPVGKPLVDHLSGQIWEVRVPLEGPNCADTVHCPQAGNRSTARFYQEGPEDADGRFAVGEETKISIREWP
jgi:Phage derived protein Gp49-like (DUF891)